MRSTTRTARAVVALAVLAAVIGVLPAIGGAADEKPTDSEIGVTAKEIHIATVADVDNSFAPGLFQRGVDGVNGAVQVHQRQRRDRRAASSSSTSSTRTSTPTTPATASSRRARTTSRMVGTRHVPDRQLRRRHQLRRQGGRRPPASPTSPATSTSPKEACSPVTLRADRQPARLQHGRPGSADVHRPDRRLEVLREEVRARPARVRSSSAATRPRRRTPRRCSGTAAEKGGIDDHRHDPDRQHGSAERVHAGHPADEERRRQLQPHRRTGRQRDLDAPGGAAAGAHRSEVRVDLPGAVLRQEDRGRRATSWRTRRSS